jgi:hypothetical protein
MKDLVVLVADKNAQFALQGALGRSQALGIRNVTWEFRTHVGRDGGARVSGASVLALERPRFSHAILLFDLEGSGAEEGQSAENLEQALDVQLATHWGENAKAIVIDPEVDAWIWGNDNLLKELLRWPLDGSIRDWLRGKGFELNDQGKPSRPKEALEKMVPIHRQPRSSALYEKVCNRISLQSCTDTAFLRLRTALQRWFPPEAIAE